MWGSREKLLFLLSLPIIVLPCVSWSTVEFTAAASSTPIVQTVQTATYRTKLEIGPVVQVMGMGSGMLSMDQGKPVNHHLTVSIQDKRSGATLMNIIPTIKITDEKSGTSRNLQSLSCTPPNDHGAGPHFGNNLYLPNGKHTVTVTVGSETAMFTVSL